MPLSRSTCPPPPTPNTVLPLDMMRMHPPDAVRGRGAFVVCTPFLPVAVVSATAAATTGAPPGQAGACSNHRDTGKGELWKHLRNEHLNRVADYVRR